VFNIDAYISTLYITEESMTEVCEGFDYSKLNDGLGKTIMAIIDFIIKKIKDLGSFIANAITALIDKIKKWFNSKNYYTKKQQIMIAKQLKEIDIQLKSINTKLKELSPDDYSIETTELRHELETKYEKLANDRVQLVEKYKFLNNNYIISDSHYIEYLKATKDCDNALHEIESYFVDFSTKIGKYDYIPLMQNNAAANIDMKATISMYEDQPLTTRVGAQVGASATVAAKRAANAYHKVYNESDPEYIEYIDIIETYNDTTWMERIKSYKERINTTLSTIRERFKTETNVGSIKLFPMAEFDRAKKSIDKLESIKVDMHKSIKRYEYILNTNYKLPGEHFKRKHGGLPFQFITQKAPKYLMDIVNIFTRFATEFGSFISLKHELLNTISVQM